MRSRSLLAGRAALVAGTVALAFFSGGYFDRARTWAGLVAWLLVVLAAVCVARPLPRAPAARVALAAIVALAAWTLLSALWAPAAGPAYHDGQRVWLYAGALIAATALLGEPVVLRRLEPALAAGMLVIVGYGLSERLLPGLVTLDRSRSAFGRLEQPLTYWNAMGVLAALGVVLAARLAGDATRPVAHRAAAAAAAAPLGMGLYVTFSRGALFACGAGLVVLAVAAPGRALLRGGAVAVLAATAGALAAAPFDGVTDLAGSHGTRVGQGLAALALLAAIALVAAGALVRLERRAGAAADRLTLPRGAGWLALAVVVGGFALFLAVGSHESGGRLPAQAGATRFTTLKSNRYEYWRVAGRLFEHHPIAGAGASGFAPAWLKERPFAEGAHDAHSLYIETAAELGLVGLALLAALIGGVAWAGRAARRIDPVLVAGPLAGTAVWAAHVAVDWDWEMPAATLPFLLLAGAVLGVAAREAA